ncbi:MAG: 3-deoxy-D-manno-octulosonic acid transferase [Terriglobales bacterium]
MFFFYSAVLAVALLFSLPYWLVQMLRHGKYREGLAARLGRIPPHIAQLNGVRSIWVHAVSVGELLGAAGLIRDLCLRFPTHRVLISTTTATGQKLARERFGADNVFYFPLDFRFALRPYFRVLRPELIVVVETELWPNFFRMARHFGARIAVINARVSDRSFPRYRVLSRFLQPILDCVDLFLAQSRQDAGRIVAIGANPERVEAAGNLKFDIPAGTESPLVAQLRTAIAGPVLVCGSSVEGEEPVLLDGFRHLRNRFPGLVMVLAPRHPQRFGHVAELVSASGQPCVRRSEWDGSPLAGGIFLLDSIGELADVYQLANVAFVGGSLAPRGGHNILEAARFGVPVVVGPHNENFRDTVRLFQQAGALRIADAATLSTTFEELLADPHLAHDLGVRAREAWRRNTGATARTLTHLESLLPRRPRVLEMPRKENA